LRRKGCGTSAVERTGIGWALLLRVHVLFGQDISVILDHQPQTGLVSVTQTCPTATECRRGFCTDIFSGELIIRTGCKKTWHCSREQ
jgi:hypothetical protein